MPMTDGADGVELNYCRETVQQKNSLWGRISNTNHYLVCRTRTMYIRIIRQIMRAKGRREDQKCAI